MHDGQALTAFVHRCLDEPAYAAELGRRARQLVASQLGATDRTLRRLLPLVDFVLKTPPNRQAA